ncbi:MAG: nucleotidyltransferase family protein [Methylococcaceae bacterium]|nr:nucleotidyltransferase family protein [Methylococcaceae bacterium]
MTASLDNVYAVILAAGASTRMGSPKQLLVWENRTLLEHAVLNARSLLQERCVVVLGAHAEAIQASINLNGASVIVNPHWQEGIASSIRAGIRALPASANSAVILLCDQPLIGAEQIRTLLNGWQNEPSRIVASYYRDGAGVPAVFPTEFFGELLNLEGDRGAKKLLMKFDESLLKIALPEAALDIDSAGDLETLTVSRQI